MQLTVGGESVFECVQVLRCERATPCTQSFTTQHFLIVGLVVSPQHQLRQHRLLEEQDVPARTIKRDAG